MSEQQRIDKWLWATRVFKTRSIAADACKKGRVSISGRTLKPSSMIKVGDRIEVRKPPMTLSLEVLQLLNNRVGPKLVHIYQRNLTPQSEYDLWELHRDVYKRQDHCCKTLTEVIAQYLHLLLL